MFPMERIQKLLAKEKSIFHIFRDKRDFYEDVVSECDEALREIKYTNKSDLVEAATEIHRIHLAYARRLDTLSIQMCLTSYIRLLERYKNLCLPQLITAHEELVKVQSSDNINKSRLTLADYYYQAGQYHNAIELIDTIIDILSDSELVNGLNIKVRCLLDPLVANGMQGAVTEVLSQARMCFEKMAEINVSNHLRRYKAIEDLYYATLCGMITDGTSFEGVYHRYLEMYPALQNSPTNTFIRKIFAAMNTGVKDMLADAASERDGLCVLDPLSVTLLGRIKSQIQEIEQDELQ